jgi:fumarylpyruvate hydrolase
MLIKNIYCIGRNYKLHAQELNNAIPTSPFLFAKPTHALADANGQTLTMPGDQGGVHYEVELVLHITKAYEPGMKMEDLIDKVSIGVDLTLRDVQDELKKKSYPWLLAKGFPNSAVLSEWFSFEGLEALSQYDFTLEKNGKEVQRGNIKDMIFDIPTILEFCAKHFGLGEGDVIFTGTPAGVGPVVDGDRVVLKWKEEKVGEFTVGME